MLHIETSLSSECQSPLLLLDYHLELSLLQILNELLIPARFSRLNTAEPRKT